MTTHQAGQGREGQLKKKPPGAKAGRAGEDVALDKKKGGAPFTAPLFTTMSTTRYLLPASATQTGQRFHRCCARRPHVS